MGFFDKIFRSKQSPVKEEEKRGSFFDYLLYNSSGYNIHSKAMLLSTVYRCVEVISDSVAQLPLEPFKIDNNGYKEKYKSHVTYRLLNKEPNRVMTRFTFLKTLITSVLLNGNGYAYIRRDSEGNAIELLYLDPDSVSIVKTSNYGVKYKVNGIKGYVESINMIHLLNFSYDGFEGVSTLTHAKKTIGIALDSENHCQGFFKGGGNLSGILKVNSSLNPKQKSDLKSSWMGAFSSSDGTPNGIAVLEGNMDFQPIQISPADSQLLESRQFNVIDICRFFGVSPVKAFDLSKSSYSTVEATQLSFLSDTLSPLLEKIELEFERKLYKPSERDSIEIKFDTTSLLRADKASQASYYNQLFQIGAITTNEIRRALDLPALEDGNNSFVQVNVIPLKDAVKKFEIENIESEQHITINDNEGKGNKES